MRKLRHIAFAIIILSAITVKAQEKKMEAAEEYTEKYNFNRAIKVYEQLERKGYRTAALYKKLGDAYYFKNEPDKAVKWYRELFKQKKEVIEPEYYYRLALSLKTIGKYDDANSLLAEFAQKNGKDIRADLYDKNKNYLNAIESNSGRYKISITQVSTSVSDYGPAFYGDNQVVFASNMDSLGFTEVKDKWTNHSFTGLYIANITPKGNLVGAEKFSKNVQTKFHESTPAFTKDKKVMYFTRNNFNEGKVQRDNKDHILLKIYRAEADGEKWKNIKELPFTSNSYNTAHPCLSPDEKTLYFASDMPGGIGQSDIYSVSINEDGTFGTPENLGAGINTEARETFPFVTGDKLYFASDGHPGLGGLDIFIAKQEANGNFVKALNVGEPINCHWDDFGFIINEETRTGFFTSNRKSGIGYDDIYSVTEYIAPDFSCRQFISGIVTDEDTGKALVGAKVSLYDAGNSLVEEVTTDEAGVYYFPVDCGQSYHVKSENIDYHPKEFAPVTISEEVGDVILPIVVKKIPPPLDEDLPELNPVAADAVPIVGMDLAKKFKIENIYFEVNKYTITPSATKQLNKIVAFMKEYPKAKIDVRSHTDSRGLASQNQLLSENRARAIVAYLIRKGIDTSRMTGKGYGETMLANKCADWVKCTEKEHKQNRRSEFIITDL